MYRMMVGKILKGDAPHCWILHDGINRYHLVVIDECLKDIGTFPMTATHHNILLTHSINQTWTFIVMLPTVYGIVHRNVRTTTIQSCVTDHVAGSLEFTDSHFVP